MQRAGSFLTPPAQGWLFSEFALSYGEGVYYSYPVIYLGSIELKRSLREVEFEDRHDVVKEALSLVREASQTRDALEHEVREVCFSFLEDVHPTVEISDIDLSISTSGIVWATPDQEQVLANHRIQTISFALGGDYDDYDCVCYVARNKFNVREVHVFDCGPLSNQVLATIGQAFVHAANEPVEIPEEFQAENLDDYTEYADVGLDDGDELEYDDGFGTYNETGYQDIPGGEDIEEYADYEAIRYGGAHVVGGGRESHGYADIEENPEGKTYHEIDENAIGKRAKAHVPGYNYNGTDAVYDDLEFDKGKRATYDYAEERRKSEKYGTMRKKEDGTVTYSYGHNDTADQETTYEDAVVMRKGTRRRRDKDKSGRWRNKGKKKEVEEEGKSTDGGNGGFEWDESANYLTGSSADMSQGVDGTPQLGSSTHLDVEYGLNRNSKHMSSADLYESHSAYATATDEEYMAVRAGAGGLTSSGRRKDRSPRASRRWGKKKSDGNVLAKDGDVMFDIGAVPERPDYAAMAVQYDNNGADGNDTYEDMSQGDHEDGLGFPTAVAYDEASARRSTMFANVDVAEMGNPDAPTRQSYGANGDQVVVDYDNPEQTQESYMSINTGANGAAEYGQNQDQTYNSSEVGSNYNGSVADYDAANGNRHTQQSYMSVNTKGADNGTYGHSEDVNYDQNTGYSGPVADYDAATGVSARNNNTPQSYMSVNTKNGAQPYGSVDDAAAFAGQGYDTSTTGHSQVVYDQGTSRNPADASYMMLNQTAGGAMAQPAAYGNGANGDVELYEDIESGSGNGALYDQGQPTRPVTQESYMDVNTTGKIMPIPAQYGTVDQRKAGDAGYIGGNGGDVVELYGGVAAPGPAGSGSGNTNNNSSNNKNKLAAGGPAPLESYMEVNVGGKLGAAKGASGSGATGYSNPTDIAAAKARAAAIYSSDKKAPNSSGFVLPPANSDTAAGAAPYETVVQNYEDMEQSQAPFDPHNTYMTNGVTANLTTSAAENPSDLYSSTTELEEAMKAKKGMGGGSSKSPAPARKKSTRSKHAPAPPPKPSDSSSGKPPMPKSPKAARLKKRASKADGLIFPRAPSRANLLNPSSDTTVSSGGGKSKKTAKARKGSEDTQAKLKRSTSAAMLHRNIATGKGSDEELLKNGTIGQKFAKKLNAKMAKEGGTITAPHLPADHPRQPAWRCFTEDKLASAAK